MVNRKIKRYKTSILKNTARKSLTDKEKKELILKDCDKKVKRLKIGAFVINKKQTLF